MRSFETLGLVLLLGGLAGGIVVAEAPKTITMDGRFLEAARARLTTDPTLKPAYAKLLQDATAAIGLKPESVTYKKISPPSGDKHDYMSLAPYWWPNPQTPSGLPYVQRDGQFNPSAKNGDTDSVRMQIMCLSSQTLSLAYYFTGEKRYAQKTAAVIKTWFIDPQTRMNPNLRYGQAVMGITDGRGIGLIDTRNLWMVIDAAILIEGSGEFSASDRSVLVKWFQDYAAWMMESAIGQDEFNQFNNHGVYYDMQLANYALFAGNTKLAKTVVQRTVDLRIAAQVAADGKMSAELERTTPFHYSAFNLDAMANVARYGEQIGVNVWKAREKTRGLHKAIDYLLPFAVQPETWPYKELNGKPETEMALNVLLRAERAYGGGIYGKAAAGLPVTEFITPELVAYAKELQTPVPTTQTSVDRLIWPILTKPQP